MKDFRGLEKRGFKVELRNDHIRTLTYTPDKFRANVWASLLIPRLPGHYTALTPAGTHVAKVSTEQLENQPATLLGWA